MIMAVVVSALLLDEIGPFAGWMGRLNSTAESRPASAGTPDSRNQSEPSAQTHPAYPPPPDSTPAEMRPVVQAFSEWMEMQHRRVGGKIADRVVGDRRKRRAVLYLTVNLSFLEQDRELRIQIAEGVWRYWAERATAANLAPRLGDAHVILIDHESEIIGGSKPSSASSIWMQKRQPLCDNCCSSAGALL